MGLKMNRKQALIKPPRESEELLKKRINGQNYIARYPILKLSPKKLSKKASGKRKQELIINALINNIIITHQEFLVKL